MTKKLFSIFVTSFVLISGVIMMPGGVDALSIAPSPECRVEGIVVGGTFKEASLGNPMIGAPDTPERYQILVHITGTELIGDAGFGECTDSHRIQYNQYYSFPLSIISPGMTVESILGYNISFHSARSPWGLASDIVLTPRPGQLDFCTVEGILISEPINPAHTCIPGGNMGPLSTCNNGSLFDFKVTKIQGITGQCNQLLPVGSSKFAFLRDTNTLNKQSFVFEKGSKIRLLGALDSGFNSLGYAFSGTVLASPEKEDPKPKPDPKPEEPKDKEITKDTNDEQQDESDLIPLQPIEPNDQQGVPFWFGVIIMGLVSVIIIMWMYIRMRLQDK